MGVTERKEREKEQRRNAILEAAEKVFLARGVENTTMDEVAALAEFSKGTLYLYFKDKNDLFHGVIARALVTLYNLFASAVEKEKRGIDKIKALGMAYYEFYKNEPDYFNMLLHQDLNPLDPASLDDFPSIKYCSEVGGKIFALMQDCLRAGIADGSIRSDLDPVKMSLILWGHSSGILHLFKAKEKVIRAMFGSEVEEIVDYSFNMIRDYLENPGNGNNHRKTGVNQ